MREEIVDSGQERAELGVFILISILLFGREQ